MPIKVDAYMAEGIARGVLARAGSLREVLEHEAALRLERVQWQPLDGKPGASPGVAIPIDDVLIATGDEQPTVPVHASWHGIRLEVGPYVVEGEMATLPGFDPGRALTRPTGEFVQLRDVRIGRRTGPSASADPVPIGHHALVNRYGVESVACDLMLGFFFPGAEMIHADVAETGAI
ncbi:MAG TPA: hypothetical protein VK867_07615 [Candidatus Limnocylindrales bacterium]|nr:hypothetical protein [Candidatus Limnocylindrales bacterium]